MIRNKKVAVSILLCTLLTTSFGASTAYALDDSGKIDLYEVFSSKTDRLKTEVGSNIYKWSMHLPDDGIIYKSDKANYFNMSTTSYQSAIQLYVEKNEESLALEELLYQMQNRPQMYDYYYYYEMSNEYVMDIATDEAGQKYIRIIKSNQMYDYFLMNEAAQQEGDYIENRIYIANGFVYNLTVNMQGRFYRQHQEMFDKLVSSFKLSFDESNPYIKELSDSVSKTREYKNNSYGWNITMSPYWKLQGTPNARVQRFSSVYTDEELSKGNASTEEAQNVMAVQEGIVVSLVSSPEKDETVANWAAKELDKVKKNYNSNVYEVLTNKAVTQNGLSTYQVAVRYKTVTNNPYIVHNVYVIGNGYKYLVSATMKEDKYLTVNKKKDIENMISSFKLDKSALNRYLGKIVSAEDAINMNTPKQFKLKKYDFSTKLTKSWTNQGMGYDPYYEKYYGGYMMMMSYVPYISNNEAASAYESSSNMFIAMSAGLDASDIKENIKKRMEEVAKNNEIRLGLAKATVKTAEYKGAQIYCIEQKYDLKAINKFVKEDDTKIYDLRTLQNTYEYIVKIGKDIYSISISLPVANSTAENEAKIKEIWKNTTVKGVNYSSVVLK